MRVIAGGRAFDREAKPNHANRIANRTRPQLGTVDAQHTVGCRPLPSLDLRRGV
jgi:hypothetical protein